ncbi:hypothetical protein WG66_010808 [Moniliophthora roreri]|nr:hypothetical protein WG66_010808 [Moniliophthora roreri]
MYVMRNQSTMAKNNSYSPWRQQPERESTSLETQYEIKEVSVHAGYRRWYRYQSRIRVQSLQGQSLCRATRSFEVNAIGLSPLIDIFVAVHSCGALLCRLTRFLRSHWSTVVRKLPENSADDAMEAPPSPAAAITFNFFRPSPRVVRLQAVQTESLSEVTRVDNGFAAQRIRGRNYANGI